MFKRSFWVVMSLIGLSFIAGTIVNWISSGQLPSAYDPGVSIETAMQTSKKPLLVEFYADNCSTCRTVTPWVHDYLNSAPDEWTLVMLDMENPDHLAIAQLFGVETLPGLYMFDPKRMRKATVDIDSVTSEPKLSQAIASAKKELLIERPRKAPPPLMGPMLSTPSQEATSTVSVKIKG